jgi:intracellular sulfur oxidation DsrE/DsrF family protein
VIEGAGATVSSILVVAGIAAGMVSLLRGLCAQVLATRVAAMANGAAIRTLYDLNTEADTYTLLARGVPRCACNPLLADPRSAAVARLDGGDVLAALLVGAGLERRADHRRAICRPCGTLGGPPRG